MAIRPYKPWWAAHFDEFDNFFDEDFPLAVKKSAKDVFAPDADIYETEKEVIAEISLPGADPEKVDVSVEDNTLVVKGSTEKKTEVEKKGYYRKEIRSGSFYRSVALPVPVQKDNTTAEFEKGVLKVTMPKADPEREGKKIEIKVNE